MDKDSIIKEVVRIIRSSLDSSYKIYLFGSWAAGDALPTSDLDIGILGPEKVKFDILVKISKDVEAILSLRKIDIVDLNSTEENFRINALKNAKLLEYAGNNQ